MVRSSESGATNGSGRCCMPENARAFCSWRWMLYDSRSFRVQWTLDLTRAALGGLVRNLPTDEARIGLHQPVRYMCKLSADRVAICSNRATQVSQARGKLPSSQIICNTSQALLCIRMSASCHWLLTPYTAKIWG